MFKQSYNTLQQQSCFQLPCLKNQQGNSSTKASTPNHSESEDNAKMTQTPAKDLNQMIKQEPFEIDVKPKKVVFQSQEEKIRYIEEYTKKIKTEMCKNWITTNSCKFGDKCSFAHGKDELQFKNHLHQNYKTKPCKKYFFNGFCSYGNRCQYIHTVSELISLKNFAFLKEVYPNKTSFQIEERITRLSKIVKMPQRLQFFCQLTQKSNNNN